MSVPPDLYYTTDHEWLRTDEYIATVGITDFAAQALGDIVFVQPPAVGSTVSAGAVCGEIESTKSVSDLYSPVAGEVVAVNDDVTADPALLNSDPFGTGWLFKVRVSDLPPLLDADAYRALISGDNG
ncbi:glycine cleavage system protein GcvH [Dactylosporangium sp. NPDC048998]|uniref:glycine cleavage system protein GcvH n=1 Tax=Dactylosporangium sp. NPDC048998 TaxID=3363976 RepID=UPI003714A4E4